MQLLRFSDKTLDEVFFDKDMLATLAYDEEYTYAIYLPFFFPFFVVVGVKVLFAIKKRIRKIMEHKESAKTVVQKEENANNIKTEQQVTI